MTTRTIFDAATDGPDPWELVSDRVMGGKSDGALEMQEVAGRPALHLTGTVSTENGGGFLQMARDVEGAAGWDGLELSFRGNGDSYNVHLRSTRLDKPWQSFRAEVFGDPNWQTLRLPFSDFTPHRTEAAFDPGELRRIGFVAIGRAFHAEFAVSRVALYAA